MSVIIQQNSLPQRDKKGRENKNSTILRAHSAIMCIYFLVLLLTVFVTEELVVFAFSVPCFFAYCLCFYLSYKVSPTGLLMANCLLTVFFVTAFVYVFGWDCGSQQFIFVLVVMIFAAGMKNKKRAMLETGALCVFRVLLFEYTQFFTPMVALTSFMRNCFQLVNTIAIFVLLCSCLMIVAVHVQDKEERLRKLEVQVTKYANEDPLTGLANRRTMMQFLEQITGQEHKICIAVGDVDSFGKINDRYGHDCGDIVLKQLSYIMEKHITNKGMAARWGGEEFLLAFVDMTGEDAYYYLTQLQQQVRGNEFMWNDESIKLTMTYGLMEYNSEKGIDYCIVEADKKLLMGKESGRNTIIF